MIFSYYWQQYDKHVHIMHNKKRLLKVVDHGDVF